MAAEAGQLELNAFEPILFHSLFESIVMLTRVCGVFEVYCVRGITADEEGCRRNLMNSTAFATVLCPIIGYERATNIVRQALSERRQVLYVAAEQLHKSEEEIRALFDRCISQC